MPQRMRTELANEVSQNFPRELLRCKPHLAMFFRWVVDDYTPKRGSSGSNDIRTLRSLV